MIETQVSPKVRRLEGLDGLRGVLALTVAVSHSLILFLGYAKNIYFFVNIGVCVDVFFILSGIVLCFAYETRMKSHQLSSFGFFITRIFRLWPLYAFSTLLLMLVFYITKGYFIPPWCSHENAVLSIPLLQNLTSLISPANSGPINGPAWSISVELWIGCLVFLLYILNKWTAVLAFFVSGFMFWYFNINPLDLFSKIHDNLPITTATLRGIYCFSAGIIAWNIAKRLQTIKHKYFTWFCYASMIGLFLIVWHITPVSWSYVLIVPILSFGIALLPAHGKKVLDMLETPFIKKLGKYSYSIYLTHYIFIHMLLPFKSKYDQVNIIIALFAILLTCLIAPFFYEYVEKKFITIGKKLLKRRKAKI